VPHPARFLFLSVACLAATSIARTARAADNPPRDPGWFELELHALRGLLDLANRPIVDKPPYRAAGLVYLGPGAQTGGELALRFTLGGGRIGQTFALWGASGVGLGHVPLGADLQTSLHRPMGFDTALSLGYEFGSGRVRPYIDGRVGFGTMSWRIDVRSARLGALTPLSGDTFYPIFEPRLGVMFQLWKPLSLDIAFSVSPFGFARMTTFAGLGVRWELPKPEPRAPRNERRTPQ
jgi:hypothetical protein